MFKITRAVKQIFSAARNLGQKASVSISSGLKYCTQSKGYVEDASGEFTFEKIVSNQSLTQDKMNSFNTVCPNISKPQSIDWHAIRKLIYARFADEIGKQVVEHTKAEAVKGISEEFKELRSQGYDFKEVAKLIEQKKSIVVNDCIASKSSNISSSSLTERMKKLSIAGYLSNYAGEEGLRQAIEEVMLRKQDCISELKSMFSINNGLSYDNYDGSELVTLVGIEAM